ncbi:MAG: hypothetical protein AB7V48_16675 [Sedimentibacter sp.]
MNEKESSGKEQHFTEAFDDTELAEMNNVAGESAKNSDECIVYDLLAKKMWKEMQSIWR